MLTPFSLAQCVFSAVSCVFRSVSFTSKCPYLDLQDAALAKLLNAFVMALFLSIISVLTLVALVVLSDCCGDCCCWDTLFELGLLMVLLPLDWRLVGMLLPDEGCLEAVVLMKRFSFRNEVGHGFVLGEMDGDGFLLSCCWFCLVWSLLVVVV